jgi:thiopurine S-methyltransferase
VGLNADFWRARWREKRIGFHQRSATPLLVAEYDRFAPRANSRVLVPLCGKAKDLRWLADRGHEVVGIEVVKDALDQFVAEEGEDEKITLIASDFLAVKGIAPCAWAFDRGALVAMAPDDRERYVAHELSLLEPGGAIFLVAVTYDEAKMSGPPFSLTEAEVRALFARARSIEKLAEQDALDDRFRERGLDWITETAYAVRL